MAHKKKSTHVRISLESAEQLNQLADKQRRTFAAEVEHMLEFYNTLSAEFGHDNIHTILNQIRAWKAEAAKPHCEDVSAKKKSSLHHAV